MKKYLVKTPWWLRSLYPKRIWRIPSVENKIYFTFDDGPHPTITPFVLDILKKYDAKATFFCIGNNVERYPEVFKRVIDEGHSVGNHTYHHVNGWKEKTDAYLKDVSQATIVIPTNLFRPPYGRINSAKAKKLLEECTSLSKIVMWDVLSGDFDVNASAEECFENVSENMSNGSVIVFHDSEKAFPRLKEILEPLIIRAREKGFTLEKIQTVA